MWYVIAGIVALALVFIWWRYTSVARGARQRDAKILPLIDPLGEKLAEGKEPTTGEIEGLAKVPYTRLALYQVLKHFERLDLFPEKYCTEESQAEALLAYWMMHPNELHDAPETIEVVETVNREVDTQTCRFYVLRYRMPAGNWAGTDWMLGLSGPFVDNDPPYSGLASSFSRCGDKYGQLEPGELVDWFISMCLRKGGVQPGSHGS